MGSIPQGPAGLQPTGQPAPMRDAEWEPAARTLPLFGMRYRWYAGQPKRILVQQPAAGVDWTYKHGGPSWLVVRSVIYGLTTSAAAATRSARLRLAFGTDTVGLFAPTATQAASLSVIYQSIAVGSTTNDPGLAYVGLPDALILADNMSLGSTTVNIQAADQYSAIAIFGEEFTDACL